MDTVKMPKHADAAVPRGPADPIAPVGMGCGGRVDRRPGIAACGSEVSRSADAAPDFELALFENGDHSNGEVLSLSDLVGKPVVLNHWFPSCPPCVAEMPDFEEAYQKYKDEVEFIGVQNMGVDTAEDGQEFVNQLGVNYAVGPDNNPNNELEIFIAHKITGFPTTEFLNKEHEVVRKWSGLLDAEKLDELIQELLAE